MGCSEAFQSLLFLTQNGWPQLLLLPSTGLDCKNRMCNFFFKCGYYFYFAATTPMCEQWSDWSECSSSETCTQGIKTRDRHCPGSPAMENEPCVNNCTIPGKL